MNIGLVLGGGAAKGAYHAGFLKALNEDLKCTPNHVTSISCSSIGVFGGYAYSANKLDLLCDIWQQIHFDSIVDVMNSVWFKHFLKDMIKALATENDYLQIPVYSPICYFPLIHLEYGRLLGDYHKKWRRFMLGAVSYPIVSGGIHFFRGQLAIDGGAMDNIPIAPLLYNEKPDVILALHFNAGFKPRKIHVSRGIPIIDYDITIDSIYRKHSFDFHGDILNARIENGYEYGKRICSLLFNGGANTLQELCEAAKVQKDKEEIARMDNTTFESWVQLLNDIFYPFISKTKVRVRDLCVPKAKTNELEELRHADEPMP